jgi:hypothetical protein
MLNFLEKYAGGFGGWAKVENRRRTLIPAG